MRLGCKTRYPGIPGLIVMAAGDTGHAVCFTEDQAAVRATGTGRIYERLWEYMTAGDPEYPGYTKGR